MTSIAIAEVLGLHEPRDVAPRYIFYMKGRRVFATTIVGNVKYACLDLGGKLKEIYVDPNGTVHYQMGPFSE